MTWGGGWNESGRTTTMWAAWLCEKKWQDNGDAVESAFDVNEIPTTSESTYVVPIRYRF